MPDPVRWIPITELRDRALSRIKRRYGSRASSKRIVKRARQQSARSGFSPRVQKWCVDFARHNLTSYDTVIQIFEFWGKTVLRGYHRYILGEIARTYPELAGECRRQAEAKVFREPANGC